MHLKVMHSFDILDIKEWGHVFMCERDSVSRIWSYFSTL